LPNLIPASNIPGIANYLFLPAIVPAWLSKGNVVL